MPEFYDDTVQDNPYDADYNFGFLDNYINRITNRSAVADQQLEAEDQFYDTDEVEAAQEIALEDAALETEGTEDEEENFNNVDLFEDDNAAQDFFFGDGSNMNSFDPRPRGGSTSMNGFQSFGSYAEGRAALENQLNLYKTGKTRNPVKPDSTLYEAMAVYAPAADKNNPKAYAEFVAKSIGISPNTKIKNVDTKKWADAVEKMEGNKKGNNPGNLRPIKQTGGNIARTQQQQYIGLNDQSINDLFLPLQGTNTIRGLDNGEPVHVQDQDGYETILYGPDDTVMMRGGVKEKRFKRTY